MKTNHIIKVFCVASVGMLLISGCSRSDLYVEVDDAKAISKGAPVVWQDTYVGQVSDIRVEGGRVRIDATLQKSFRGRIHAGVKACPMVDRKISENPALFLIGGTDSSLPLLVKGSQIPEATLQETAAMNSFMGWIVASRSGKQWLIGCVLALVAGVCALKFLAGIFKFALLAGAVILVVFSSKSLRDGWEGYKSSFDSVEVRQWITDHVKDLDVIRTVLPKSLQDKASPQE